MGELARYGRGRVAAISKRMSCGFGWTNGCADCLTANYSSIAFLSQSIFSASTASTSKRQGGSRV